jgi:hypothetical protein
VKQYLYVGPGNRWYLSPITMDSWSWSAYQALTGTYTYCDGTNTGTFPCNGGESGTFGVGCSNGPNATFKTLPIYASNPPQGQCTICQDKPDAFGGPVCQTNVSIYYHYVQ